jgi:PBP1b-binding outer membrane lipoprotein LpoB
MKTRILAVLAVGALVLTACSREAPITDEQANGLPDDANITDATNVAAGPANVAENAVKPPPLPTTMSDGDQMQDDADATGMTARVDQGENTAGANEAAAEAK